MASTGIIRGPRSSAAAEGRQPCRGRRQPFSAVRLSPKMSLTSRTHAQLPATRRIQTADPIGRQLRKRQRQPTVLGRELLIRGSQVRLLPGAPHPERVVARQPTSLRVLSAGIGAGCRSRLVSQREQFNGSADRRRVQVSVSSHHARGAPATRLLDDARADAAGHEARGERIGVVVPDGRDGGIPGSWDWTGLAFAFFAVRGLAIRSHAPILAQSH
jgi:hypothetical protein